MWKMFLNALKLFLKGKLFRDPHAVLKKWLIGCVVSLLAVIILAKAGVPLWLTVVMVAFGSGALQPWLFRNLKYK